MNSREFEDYKRRFLEGDLSKEEKAEFRKLLSERDGAEGQLFQHYFDLTDQSDATGFTPLSKETFFEAVSVHQGKKRGYRVAAAITGIMMVCTGYYGLHVANARRIARAEVDRSIETTRRALNTFSTHINAGLEGMNRGLDLSEPLRVFSKLKIDHLKTEDDASNKVKE